MCVRVCVHLYLISLLADFSFFSILGFLFLEYIIFQVKFSTIVKYFSNSSHIRVHNV